jgi:hypothetical protein
MSKELMPDLSGEVFNEWTQEDLQKALDSDEQRGQQQAPQNPQPANPEGEHQIIRDGSDAFEEHSDFLKGFSDNPLQKQEQPNYLAEPDPQNVEGNQEQQPPEDPVVDPQQQAEPEPQEEGQPNVYQAAFDMLKEIGLVQGDAEQITDEAALYALRDQTYRAQYQTAMDSIIQGAAQRDPYMGQLLDYALRGGGFADVPKMQEIIQNEIDYTQAPVETAEQKTAYVSDYLYYKGTPPEYIDSILKDLNEEVQLDEKVTEARQFFAAKAQHEKEQEYQRIQQEQQRQAYYAQQQRQQAEAWNQQFMHGMQSSGWAEQKQREVLNEYRAIPLEDGRQMPLYEYKTAMIRRDPGLFRQYLDWLTKLDLETMSFANDGNVSRQQENTVARKIINNIHKKTGNQRGGGNPAAPRDKTQSFVANPYNAIQ